MSGKKKDDDDITFVVTTNPYDATSAANKKRVRSVAALKSWPERRKRTFEQYDQSARQGGFVLDLPETPQGPFRPPTVQKKARIAGVEPAGSFAGEFAFQPAHQAQGYHEEPLFETCTRASDGSCNCVHCRSERRYRQHGHFDGGLPAAVRSRKRSLDGELKREGISSQRDLAMITPPASRSPTPTRLVKNVGGAEPFNCYPVPHRPWFDRILHHMMTVFAPRGWPALKITNEEGLKWEWFMTQHALAEPALFYVRLLFASGDLIRLEALNPEVSYWLQTQAVQSINEALADPKRATSDALILAVGRIALHESLYGDRNAAVVVHRPAQKRMIQMRGGMRALPFPELIKRLMRWADTVMAKQSGTERILEDDEQSENFTIRQHVDVLQEWVPTEAQDLRKKIKISDLLSPDPS